MVKVLISFILTFVIISASATIETNKRGGHGIFHGLQDGNGKSSWLEEPKVEDVKISPGNTNSLLSNSAKSNSKKSALFLQPEPRGLDYLLGVPDQNPMIFRKRDVSHQIPNLRRKRQSYNPSGNVIPGSMGQAVLYGFPNQNSFPNSPNGFVNPNLPNGNNFNFGGSYLGNPSGYHQNGGFPQQMNQHVGGYKTYGY